MLSKLFHYSIYIPRQNIIPKHPRNGDRDYSIWRPCFESSLAEVWQHCTIKITNIPNIDSLLYITADIHSMGPFGLILAPQLINKPGDLALS
jgi:hypothetical protein